MSDSAQRASPANASTDGEPVAVSAFATTHWSMVLNAQQEDSSQCFNALSKLCKVYWYPLYAFIRRKGYSAHDAQDLTQEFFASLLRHESLSSVRREKGRFRTFLLTSLNYFLSDQRDKAMAAKRGGGRAVIELDGMTAEQRYAAEPATHETPDKEFDRNWASALVERALERMREESIEAGREKQFGALRVFLTRETVPGEYEELGRSLDLSANAVAAAVRRMRVRFREITVSEVMHTVGNPADAESELRALWEG